MLPAHDRYHWQFQTALEKSNWEITAEPLTLEWEGTRIYVDFGAMGKPPDSNVAIPCAFELKSLDEESGTEDLRDALGQYLLYRSIIRRVRADISLYLAVSALAYEQYFSTGVGAIVRQDYGLSIVVFDPDEEEIVQWWK